jgi:hypothetical protein
VSDCLFVSVAQVGQVKRELRSQVHWAALCLGLERKSIFLVDKRHRCFSALYQYLIGTHLLCGSGKAAAERRVVRKGSKKGKKNRKILFLL